MANRVLLKSILWSAVSLSVFSEGCAVAAKNKDASDIKPLSQPENSVIASAEKSDPPTGKITFAPNSPADTIRLFYKNLREKHFREAIMLTNLRVAVENLSDAEMRDLNADFEPLAAQIPAELQISGEIITAGKAVVTVKLPNEDTGALEDKVFNLQRENDAWIYLMADAETAAAARKEGKNYFFMLRQEVHHGEARSMLAQIVKAETVYALHLRSVKERKICGFWR